MLNLYIYVAVHFDITMLQITIMYISYVHYAYNSFLDYVTLAS